MKRGSTVQVGPTNRLGPLRSKLETEWSTEGHAKKQKAANRRREQVQADDVEDLLGAVGTFLGVYPSQTDHEERLARAVTEQVMLVESDTVARTERIPIEQRAKAAVIIWMRPQRTGYDGMAIPRVMGKGREVRRMLALCARKSLQRYQSGIRMG